MARDILDSIDIDSCRVEKRAAMKIAQPDQDAEIEPAPGTDGGNHIEPELDRRSNIVYALPEQLRDIPWTDKTRVNRLITHPGAPVQGAGQTGLTKRLPDFRTKGRAHRTQPGPGQGNDGKHAGQRAAA